MLDLNEMAKGERFMAVGDSSVTDDGNLLAYTTDNTGFREYTLHVKDLSTGKDLPETVEKVSSVAWAADNKTLFYTVDDAAKRPYRLYRHALGADPKTDALVYEEKDEMFRVGVTARAAAGYLFLAVRLPHGRRVAHSAGRQAGRRFDARSRRARRTTSTTSTTAATCFYIRTNNGVPQLPRRHGAGRDPGPARLEGARPLPRGRHGLRASSSFRDSHGRSCEREDGLPRIRVIDLALGAGSTASSSRSPSTRSARRATPSSTRRRSASATSPSRRRRRSTTTTWRRRSASS